jgi:hypothetical protein
MSSSKTSWAVLLPRQAALAAGAFRLRTDIEVNAREQDLWLRGPDLTEDLDRALRKLPGAERFTVSPDRRLTPIGARVPTGTLPAEGWRPLSSWLVPAPQPAALAGELPSSVDLRLVRTDRERPATVLMTTLADWVVYATTAPAVRLRPLRFAAAADGRALVRGTPLPPIQGRRYAEAAGVALPLGYEWAPPVEPAVVRKLLGLEEADLALFDEDGSYERIDAGQFARATRSAARATVAP